MKLKKANATFGLLTILMLLVHAGYQMVAFVKFIYVTKTTMTLAAIIMCLLMVHVILAMCIMMFNRDGTNITAYPRANIRTIIQRGSAIGIIIFLIGHIYAHRILTSETLGSAGVWISMTIQILFYGMVFAHIATSFSNGLVTLGILQSEKKKASIDKVVITLCAVAFVCTSIITSKTFVLLANMPR